MAPTITIAPSLLASDFLNIEEELKTFDGITDLWFHLDVMDGHFVPNLTFGHSIIEQICKKSSHKCDVHLMVTNPEFYSESMKFYKIHNMTFHLESTNHPLKLIKALKVHYPSVGISIKPQTKTSELSDEILKAIDLVLIMSVEPGFGGQSFLPSAYDKIRELVLRRNLLDAHFSIQADGGISDKNAHELIKSGADNLVAGSYIFKNKKEYYKEAVNSLR